MSAAVDTSALIALAQVRLLHLFPALFTDVYIPAAVTTEWDAGSQESLEQTSSTQGLPRGWFVTPSPGDSSDLDPDLGAGEREVIAFARLSKVDYVVLDELKARRVAQSLGLRVIGTVGILHAAEGLGLIQSASEIVESLRDAGFRLSDEIVRQAGP